ncbi:MAG: GNAT family N-acetyltransferase [Candidatus Helarchaeales archaeon]
MAENKDLTDLVDLWWELFSTHQDYDPRFYSIKPERLSRILISEYFEKSMKSDDHIFVLAEEEGRAVGMIHCEILKRPPIFSEEREGLLVDVVVDPEHRGREIFQRMFDFLKIKLKIKEIKTCTLLVDVLNSSGFRAYQKAGFKERQRFLTCYI